MRGWKPVIAHAERYGVFQRNPHLAAEAADAGAGIQVNDNSILGLDGRILKKTAKKLLDLDMVDYIASDAHDMGERAGHMGECYSYILKKYGNDSAQRLFEQNPGRILDEGGSIQPG
jgi:protein-tyrosine phosphatase